MTKKEEKIQEIVLFFFLIIVIVIFFVFYIMKNTGSKYDLEFVQNNTQNSNIPQCKTNYIHCLIRCNINPKNNCAKNCTEDKIQCEEYFI